jgi:hypothetical protein
VSGPVGGEGGWAEAMAGVGRALGKEMRIRPKLDKGGWAGFGKKRGFDPS